MQTEYYVLVIYSCPEDTYPNTNNYVSKSDHHTESSLQHYKGKILKFLWLLLTLTDFNAGALVSTTRLQIIFDVCPLFWRMLWLAIDTASFRALTFRISLFSIRQTREKSISVKSGDLGDQAFGAHLPIHSPGIVWLRFIFTYNYKKRISVKIYTVEAVYYYHFGTRAFW